MDDIKVYNHSMKRNCYELVFLDVSYKWLGDVKTTIELIYYDMFGNKTVLAYVHTNDDIDIARSKKDEYIDLMLKTIKENINIV